MTYDLHVIWCLTRAGAGLLAGAVVGTMLVRVAWDSWRS
jgi:hypothetical protein